MAQSHLVKLWNDKIRENCRLCVMDVIVFLSVTAKVMSEPMWQCWDVICQCPLCAFEAFFSFFQFTAHLTFPKYQDCHCGNVLLCHPGYLSIKCCLGTLSNGFLLELVCLFKILYWSWDCILLQLHCQLVIPVRQL